MKVRLQKVSRGILVPEDDAAEKLVDKMKVGQVIYADFKRQRNIQFHRKYFALLNFAYSHWEPAHLADPKWEGVKPLKSFNRFRKDLAILSGIYEATYRVDGSVRIEAKSISFGRMSEEEFEELYSNTIDVILERILVSYTREQLDQVVFELMGFA